MVHTCICGLYIHVVTSILRVFNGLFFQGFLRNMKTLEKFKSVSPATIPCPEITPLLHYCTTLMHSASLFKPLSSKEAMEFVLCALDCRQYVLLMKWIASGNVSHSIIFISSQVHVHMSKFLIKDFDVESIWAHDGGSAVPSLFINYFDYSFGLNGINIWIYICTQTDSVCIMFFYCYLIQWHRQRLMKNTNIHILLQCTCTCTYMVERHWVNNCIDLYYGYVSMQVVYKYYDEFFMSRYWDKI